jgi:alpha-tubulin suppressor-like RCC1 family protein
MCGGDGTPNVCGSCAGTSCDANASCNVVSGKATCQCNLGYTGPGSICTPTFSVLTVAVGNYHACSVALDHTLWCWGSNSRGQLGIGASPEQNRPVQIGTAADWLSVAAGGNTNQCDGLEAACEGHTCALRADGQLFCWGANGSGQLGDGSMTDRALPVAVAPQVRWTSVAAGPLSTCGIQHDGTLWCWGFIFTPNSRVIVTAPQQVGTDTDWAQVSVGDFHACALRVNGSLWCWGESIYLGVMPVPPVAYVTTPVAVASGMTWQGLDVGYATACVIRTDGTLWCLNVDALAQVGTDPDWSQVSGNHAHFVTDTFESHTCALKRDGSLWCWGRNASGQLGLGLVQDQSDPLRVGTGWSAVITNGSNTCGVWPDHSLHCWGDNSFGQVGRRTTGTKPEPAQSDPSSDWVSVSAGAARTCGIRVDHSLWCWGRDVLLDTGTPVATRLGAASWAKVSCGESHCCAIQQDGTLWCWGRNTYGQLGDGTRSDRAAPVLVPSDKPWQAVFTSVNADGQDPTTCGITADGTLWCWGANTLSPAAMGPAASFANGGIAACTLRQDGTLSCRIEQVVSGQVGSDTDWTAVTAGDELACGLRAGGSLWCFGQDYYEALGLASAPGIAEESATPIRVGGQTSWSEVATNGHEVFALTADGELYRWGRTSLASVYGAGADTSTATPAQLGHVSGLAGISVGFLHGCAIRSGALYCFGRNDAGELGDGTGYYAVPGIVTN